MKTQIKKWGDSLAIKIPSFIAMEVGVKEGDYIEIANKNNYLTLKPIKMEYSLEELVSRITEDNMHGEVDFGRSV